MPTVLLVNGPNLNRLGRREPEVYGSATLDEVVAMVRARAAELGWRLEAFQSNHEGELIDEVHRGADAGVVGIILNAGALSHYSYALHDALTAVDLPAVEVHISDISSRDEWRRTSVTAPACVAMISGHGVKGYVEALELLHQRTAAAPQQQKLRVLG
ncbi:MAG: type II 3-dehydroquinate dehydratase [Candidatus Dormibacteraeota bacterium]|nr:type II 3-dehydroquinate dehydratase [Candidatus Dormibacteraeota bacterium]